MVIIKILYLNLVTILTAMGGTMYILTPESKSPSDVAICRNGNSKLVPAVLRGCGLPYSYKVRPNPFFVPPLCVQKKKKK